MKLTHVRSGLYPGLTPQTQSARTQVLLSTMNTKSNQLRLGKPQPKVLREYRYDLPQELHRKKEINQLLIERQTISSVPTPFLNPQIHNSAAGNNSVVVSKIVHDSMKQSELPSPLTYDYDTKQPEKVVDMSQLCIEKTFKELLASTYFHAIAKMTDAPSGSTRHTHAKDLLLMIMSMSSILDGCDVKNSNSDSLPTRICELLKSFPPPNPWPQLSETVVSQVCSNSIGSSSTHSAGSTATTWLSLLEEQRDYQQAQYNERLREKERESMWQTLVHILVLELLEKDAQYHQAMNVKATYITLLEQQLTETRQLLSDTRQLLQLSEPVEDVEKTAEDIGEKTRVNDESLASPQSCMSPKELEGEDEMKNESVREPSDALSSTPPLPLPLPIEPPPVTTIGRVKQVNKKRTLPLPVELASDINDNTVRHSRRIQLKRSRGELRDANQLLLPSRNPGHNTGKRQKKVFNEVSATFSGESSSASVSTNRVESRDSMSTISSTLPISTDATTVSVHGGDVNQPATNEDVGIVPENNNNSDSDISVTECSDDEFSANNRDTDDNVTEIDEGPTAIEPIVENELQVPPLVPYTVDITDGRITIDLTSTPVPTHDDEAGTDDTPRHNCELVIETEAIDSSNNHASNIEDVIDLTE